MNFKFAIETTPISFQPVEMVVYVPEDVIISEEKEYKRIQIVYTQYLEEGVIKKDITTLIPIQDLQQLIDGYDLKTGQPNIIISSLNAYLKQFNIKVIV